jgi:PAS domain S-box-containing protein
MDTIDHQKTVEQAAPKNATKVVRPEEHLEYVLREARFHLLRYQEFFDFAPDAYLVTDLQGVIQEANHAAAFLLGANKRFLSDKPLIFYVAEADHKTFTASLRRLARPDQTPLEWEICLRPPRAAVVCVLATVSAIRFGDQICSLRWILKDVSERRKLEQGLITEREFSESLVEMASAIILPLDGAGRILRVNSYLCELTGQSRRALEDICLVDLLTPEDRESAQEALQGLASGLATARGVHHLSVLGGPPRTIAWSARALPRGAGAHVLFVGNDVTDLQHAQERALQSERLAAIGKMAAGLAHESRNCLQRIQACLSMLGYRIADRPEAQELLGRAQRAQDDLQRLYEEVRDYAAPISLDLQHCWLDHVWRRAWDDVGPVLKTHGEILAEETSGANLECRVSPFHLTRIFRNLFENALAAGANRIIVRYRDVDLDGRDALQVAVIDNGKGFAAEEARRAFEDFFTTKVHGTGLGLAICRRIVEAHGGRIALSQPTGPGAVLLITLPRRFP